jgi:NADPH:quinone reductase-like Zn-dependent oxidoreductase
MPRMRAGVLREIGGEVALVIDEIEVPRPGADEVLVEVRACGLNQIDLLTRDRRTPGEVPLPHVSGTEVAGDVAETGLRVAGWEPGDRVVVDPVLSCGDCRFCRTGSDNTCLRGRVFGVQTPGGYAEYVAVPAHQLIRIPDALSYSDAAAVAVTGPTAWHMLHRRAGVRAGEDVLVIAAASGIGVLAVQIAAQAGARVIATAGAPGKLTLATRLGAAHAVDHRQAGWPEQVRSWTSGRGVDLVFEHVGAATWSGSLRALARGGRLVTCGAHTGSEVRLDLWHLFVKEQILIGSFAGSRQDLVDVLEQVERGELRPVVHDVVGLDDLPSAQQWLRDRTVAGKVLLDPRSVSAQSRGVLS